MLYSISYVPSVAKAIQKLDKSTARRLLDAIGKLASDSRLPECVQIVTVQVSRRRLRRFRASSTGPGPDRPERRTYRCRAWPRSLHRNAPRKTTRLRPETVSTPTPSGGP